MFITPAVISLALEPWRGPSFPTTTPHAEQFKLTVRGRAQRLVHLRATGLPAGWVASFCTRTMCSPFRYNMKLDERGTGVIEFQTIRTDDAAPAHVHVIIETDGAKPVRLRIEADTGTGRAF